MKPTISMIAFVGLLFATISLIAGEPDAGLDSSRDAKNKSTKWALERISHANIKKVSDRIDLLVQKKLDANQQNLNPKSTDEVFVRRIYLDIVGRIPTMEEARSFINSNNKSKRAKLIDELLDSYGYVSHQFNYMADLLRVKSRIRNVNGLPYIDFVKDSLEQNKPYNQFVYELLASEGPMMQRGNGAVGYYLRDFSMPEDNMSNTVRIFLGTRLECAQCHDHPFDKWTQRQYFEMVAFTGGMQYRLRTPDSEFGDEFKRIRNRQKVNDKVRPVLRRLVEPMTYGISGSGTGLARLPEGFMGDDGDEFDIVTGKEMFEGKPLVDATIPSGKQKKKAKKVNKRNPQLIPGAKQVDSRQAYAEWMTSPKNPRFAKVIANRLWKRTMGIGLIEPVDVLEDGTKASNPELMEFLTKIMVFLDFDLKQFYRAIYNSQTYQAQAIGEDVTNVHNHNFNGPLVRRMTAEQIWDSLLVMTTNDIDKRRDNSQLSRYTDIFGVEGDMYDKYEALRKVSPDKIVEMAEQIADKGIKSIAKKKSKKKSKENERITAQQNETRKRLNKQIAKAKRSGNQQLLQKLLVQKNEAMMKYKKKRNGGNFHRASELPSPAPAGHFLREFGQSDRETIENSNTEPSVTQALSLMNGFIEKQVAANVTTVLMNNVIQAKPKDKIDAVYLTMLSRKPTRSEESMWAGDLKKHDGKEVVGDLIWTLANSNEFIFVK